MAGEVNRLTDWLAENKVSHMVMGHDVVKDLARDERAAATKPGVGTCGAIQALHGVVGERPAMGRQRPRQGGHLPTGFAQGLPVPCAFQS